MANYIETKTKNGQTILIEVEQSTKGVGFAPKTAMPEVVTANAYQQTLETIQACATGIIDTLQGLETPPQTTSVNFSIKIDSEVGAMIAKSAENAQFKVSLSWKQNEPEKEST
jgi:hypothetical protein